MGPARRLYPTSIHLVSIFSPPSDVAVWAFLFFFSLFFVDIEKEGGWVGEKLVLSCTKARHICLEECVVAYKDSLTLVSVGNPQSADAFVWKCFFVLFCFFAEMDKTTQIKQFRQSHTTLSLPLFYCGHHTHNMP